MEFSHTVETTAPPESVWAVWTDVERWPEWDTELESARLGTAFGLGARGRIVPRRGPGAGFVISELDPGTLYAFATRLPLCALRVRRRLEERDGTTSFTHEVSFEGTLAPLFGRVLGPRYRAALPGVMQNVRRLAEMRAASEPPDL